MELKEVEKLTNEIKNKLVNLLPKKTHVQVWVNKTFYGDSYYIGIMFSVTDYEINGVKDQHCQNVSLKLNCNTMELTPQIFGGEGGQCIYRKPNIENYRESFLCMKSVKVPFKQPKKELRFVLSAIERFAKNWIETLKQHRKVLMYQEYVNYDEFFGS